MTQKDLISVWILGDQLLRNHPGVSLALSETTKDNIRIVIVESESRFQRHAYHAKKIVLLKSSMRHYAKRLEQEGYFVDYRYASSIRAGLLDHVAEYNPSRIITMEASEYQGRQWQQTHMENVLGISVELIPDTQFLISDFVPYPQPDPTKRYVMEHFYRKMRKHFDILMDGDDPVGGQWNYDKQNRKPYPKDEVAPRRHGFVPDETTNEIINRLNTDLTYGDVDDFDLAVTHEQAYQLLGDFIENRLKHFGIYEDAMTERDDQLYHSVLSPYLNIGLLEPLQVIEAAESAYQSCDAPINSVEGLIRQVLGWREFMYWQYWRLMPDILDDNAWNATNPLPEFFWNGETEMNCMQHVLTRTKKYGYAHHIERLMILANFSTLAGLQPMEVNDWFLSAFIDAYEWVMIPNVLGMGLNADGSKIATKPYISSANYINKMSDYCDSCSFHRTKRSGEGACPFNFLYWNFLITHEDTLRSNPRFGPAVFGLKHIDDDERVIIQKQARDFVAEL